MKSINSVEEPQCSQMYCSDLCLYCFLLTDSSFHLSLPSDTQIQPVDTLEVVTTDEPEEDKPSTPLAMSPPAENLAGPYAPASRGVKSRLETLTFFFEQRSLFHIVRTLDQLSQLIATAHDLFFRGCNQSSNLSVLLMLVIVGRTTATPGI